MRHAIAAAFLCLVAVPARADMLVLGYSEPLHDRFSDDVAKAFIGDGFDWSGVGRTFTGTWSTMISDTYFLSAAHAHPIVGETVTFYYTDTLGGPSETAIVESGVTIPGTDLWLGKVVTAPSASVVRYGILDLATTAEYVGLEAFMTGRSGDPHPENMRLGRNIFEELDTVTVDLVTATSILYDYDSPLEVGPFGVVPVDEAMLVTGDSGGPSFVVTDAGLALIGIHWFVYSEDTDGDLVDDVFGSGDSYVPEHIAAISAAMAGGEAVTTITAVPEPSGVVLGGLALVVSAARRYRDRRRQRGRAA